MSTSRTYTEAVLVRKRQAVLTACAKEPLPMRSLARLTRMDPISCRTYVVKPLMEDEKLVRHGSRKNAVYADPSFEAPAPVLLVGDVALETKILLALRKSGTDLASKDIAVAVGVEVKEIRPVLANMVSRKKIRQHGAKRFTTYSFLDVKEADPVRRARTAQELQASRRYVRHNAGLTESAHTESPVCVE